MYSYIYRKCGPDDKDEDEYRLNEHGLFVDIKYIYMNSSVILSIYLNKLSVMGVNIYFG